MVYGKEIEISTVGCNEIELNIFYIVQFVSGQAN